jgi:hypothetical protein
MILSKLRQALALVALLVFAAAPALAQIPTATGTITTANLNGSTGPCTPGSCVEIEVSNKGVVDIQTVGVYTVTGGLVGKVTANGTDWVTLGPTPFTRKSNSTSATATIASGVQDVYQVSSLIAGALKFRIEATDTVTGGVAVTLHSSPTSIGSSGTISGGTDGVAQGSTTSGQSGPLVQAAVTTSAPSYTHAQTSPLSLDTAGNLRVNVVAGGAGGGNVTGGTANDAVATSVNPVLTGGYASAAAPTNVSADGDAVRDWNLPSGAKVVQPSFGGTLAATGNGTVGAGVPRFALASDSTGQVVLAAGANTIGALSANQTVNVAQVAGTTTATGSGTVTAGTLRIVDASDSPVAAAVGTTADAACGSDTGTCTELALKKRELQHLTTINTSINTDPSTAGTVAPGTAATKSMLGGIKYTSAGVTLTDGQQAAMQSTSDGRVLVSVQTNAPVNVAQINGTAPSTGNGSSDSGTLRMTLSANSTGVLGATQSGTWTVQPGNTANTTAWLVESRPGTAGGWSKVKYAAQTTAVQTVKGSAGTFGGYYIYNPNSSAAYVQIFDVSGTVTLGTTVPDLCLAIPATSAANIEFNQGVNFANAIKLAATTTCTGSTGPSTGLDLNVFYK